MASTSSISPRRTARLAGFLYLLVILGGGFAEAFVRQKLIVHGDAVATAANILANEQLFRWAFVADLLPLLCNVFLAVLFYGLFRIVNRGVALLVVMFSLTGTAIQGVALLFHLAPLLVLKGGPALGAFAPAQLDALAYLALRLQAFGYNIALAFFGCFGLCLGWLIWKSTFLPRVLGALMALAGLCYFANSMLSFIDPARASMLLLAPCLLGEGALTLWLLLVGVNAAKWTALKDTPR